MAAASGAAASSLAVRRLSRELQNLRSSRIPQIAVQPAEDNLLEWHFVLHSLPAETPYHGGCYHGKIIFPPEYPHAPPSILMLTPSGRLETGKRLCLSMTDFHPESWNPAWSVETILVGLLSFFISDAERGFGAISTSNEKRRELAAESHALNSKDATFEALFAEMLPSDSAGPAEQVAAPSSSPLVANAGGAVDSQATDTPSAGSQQPPPMESLIQQEITSVAAPVPAGSWGLALENGIAGVDGIEEETLDECWICRDTTSREPLIQPCACRGSMSGVHASCVEQWIRHHRQNAVNDAVPRCSVCHETYCGSEARPGVGGFVCHLCYDGAKSFLRSMVLVTLLMGYMACADDGHDGNGPPVALRIITVSVFGLVTLHKVLILAVSLPAHRPPPDNMCVRRFFISDMQQIAMHVAEAFAAFVVLSMWWLLKWLPFSYFLPVVFAALVPTFKILCLRQPSLACLKSCAKGLCLIILTPVLLPVFVIRLVWMHRHPLDGGPHLAVAVATVPMVLLCDSNVPVVILWGVHSTVAIAGLFEQLLVKRWQWKTGVCWWLALQFTVLAAYIGSGICTFPKGFGEPHDTDRIVLGASALWLGLVCALTVCTNWSLCIHYYGTWQSRNGTFTLQVPLRDGGMAGGDDRVVSSQEV